jgi:hypothetical protein
VYFMLPAVSGSSLPWGSHIYGQRLLQDLYIDNELCDGMCMHLRRNNIWMYILLMSLSEHFILGSILDWLNGLKVYSAAEVT